MHFTSKIMGGSLLVLSLASCANQPYYGKAMYEGRPAPSSQAYGYQNTPPPSDYQNQEYQQQYQDKYASRTGQVIEVRRITAHQASGLGAGTIVGALLGGVVGNTFGHGNGRVLTTVGGAVLGGVAGNAVQNNYDANREGYLITVRLDNGSILKIAQDTHDFIQVGQRVYIDGYGNNLRVVPE